MTLRDTKYGNLKHLLVAAVFILACELSVHAEPISITSILVSLAVSAALTAASIGLQMLFQPKPKPQDKNKLQGDIQLTNVGEDIPMIEVYGNSLGDGIGGMRHGGIIFYASPIRKVVVTVPGSGGGGGGKGAPKAPPTREYHYYIDLAILVANRGPHRVRQIKANTDVLYQAFTPATQLIGTAYEAEDRTDDSANVTQVADADMSGGLKVNLDENEWIEWDNINVSPVDDLREMHIVYKSSADIDIEVVQNGATDPQRAVLPDSFGLKASVNLPQTFTIDGFNTIRITNKTAGQVLSIDRIVVSLGTILDPIDPDGNGGGGCLLSGTMYQDWTNPEPTFDAYALRDPLRPDPRGCELWNYQSNPNALGEISAVGVNNGNIRIYPGNQTQLPDPLLQEHFEALYGAGSTPAFRNRCHVVLENFEITKYGSVPNFTFITEHESINSLGELYTALSDRAGLDAAEYDYTDLNAVPLRGYYIAERRAPARTMELLGRIFDVDVYQDYDGVIKGVIPNETVAVTIPAEDLDMEEGKDTVSDGNEDAKPFKPVEMVIRDDSELPGFLDVSYFDPAKDFETGNVHSLREIGDASARKANIETGIVLTEAEAQKFADRDLHKQHVEKDGIQVKAAHKYTYLAPTQLIRVTDEDGALYKMRVKAMEGWLPGALDIRGVSRESEEFPDRLYATAEDSPVVGSVQPPAPIVGTFIDLATFRDEQGAGFYAVAAMTDPHYRWATAGLYRELQGNDWEALDAIPNEATLGRTITGANGTLGDAVIPTLATPDPPIVSTSASGGSIGIAKSRHIKITYYDGADESLPSGATPIITTGTTSTITVDSPPASTGATHYRVYLSQGGGIYELQNGAGTAIGGDLTMTSLTTGTAQPPALWDDTNTVEIDLFNGELESLTDAQVLEGRNYLVIGDEVLQFGTATRDNSYPNRWEVSHLLRGVKGTALAATGHADEERAALFTDAWRWISQEPSLANVTRTYKFLAAGDSLDKAWSVDWSWDGQTQYNTAIYAGVDSGIPVLHPDAPTIATEGDFLRVFIKRPIQHAYTAERAEVRVRADDDDAVIRQLDIGNSVDALVLSPTEDANVDYRWQNRYRLEGSDGWSAWSNSSFYDFGTPPPPPDPTNPGGDPPGPGDIEPISCFVEDRGVLVLMADWSERPIESITRNEYVMSWTHAGRILPGRVAATMREEVSEYRDLILNDDRLPVTGTHPFLPDFNRKMRVSEMEAGQQLRAYFRGKGWDFVGVESAEAVPGPVWVRNLEVAVWHTYFVRVNGSWKAVYNLSSKEGGNVF